MLRAVIISNSKIFFVSLITVKSCFLFRVNINNLLANVDAWYLHFNWYEYSSSNVQADLTSFSAHNISNIIYELRI
jgi:hypothetical protein